MPNGWRAHHTGLYKNFHISATSVCESWLLTACKRKIKSITVAVLIQSIQSIALRRWHAPHYSDAWVSERSCTYGSLFSLFSKVGWTASPTGPLKFIIIKNCVLTWHLFDVVMTMILSLTTVLEQVIFSTVHVNDADIRALGNADHKWGLWGVSRRLPHSYLSAWLVWPSA